MRAIILTLFPDMFPGPLGQSLAGQALANGLWSLEILNIRDFATDKHRTVDDKSYGGGTGMVLRADILEAAIEAARVRLPSAVLVYPSPRGEPARQARMAELCQQDLIILCGRFEGIDQRIIDYYQPLEISFGDIIFSGGEIPAMSLLDACIRLIPGVIGKESALDEESFNCSENSAGLLEYPHYTRPPIWKGLPVPEVLASGNHAQIKAWRANEAETATRSRRPDLWEQYIQRKNAP